MECEPHPFGPAVANDMRADLGLLRALQVLVAAAAHDQWQPVETSFLAAGTESGRVRKSVFAVCMTSLIEEPGLWFDRSSRPAQAQPMKRLPTFAANSRRAIRLTEIPATGSSSTQ